MIHPFKRQSFEKFIEKQNLKKHLKVIFKINHFFVGYMKGRKNGGVRRTNFKNYSSTLTKKTNPKKLNF